MKEFGRGEFDGPAVSQFNAKNSPEADYFQIVFLPVLHTQRLLTQLKHEKHQQFNKQVVSNKFLNNVRKTNLYGIFYRQQDTV